MKNFILFVLTIRKVVKQSTKFSSSVVDYQFVFHIEIRSSSFVVWNTQFVFCSAVRNSPFVVEYAIRLS